MRKTIVTALSLVATGALVAGCGGVEREAALPDSVVATEPAASSASPASEVPEVPEPTALEESPSSSPSSAAATAESPDPEPIVGAPMYDPLKLPFAVVNNLDVDVHTRAESDPYDWIRTDMNGTPADSAPFGFNDGEIKKGGTMSAWFMPRSNKANSPFLLKFRYREGRVLNTTNLVNIEFGSLYFCALASAGAQMNCDNLFATRYWQGWGYRMDWKQSGYQANQVPAVCGRLTPEFTYRGSDDAMHTAHGRLECASPAAAGLSTAIILEDVK